MYTLSSKVRFSVQGLSAAALYFLGGVQSINFGFFILEGWWLNVIAWVAMVWITNLYNFLDGIDGYAGSQAVFVGVSAFLLMHHSIGLIIAAASLGFLVFNWQKASIFMGDVGSASLGFIFAVLCMSDFANSNIYIWLVLLAVFWMDATFTIIKRYREGKDITQAHREHLYQKFTIKGWSHQRVVLSAMGINALSLVVLWIFDGHIAYSALGCLIALALLIFRLNTQFDKV
jgi:Fuc2NAc and GlcNAc transferase